MFGRQLLTPRALEHRAREGAREAAALDRLRRPQALSDAELAEIVRDPFAGIAREVSDQELERRAGLTAHQRIAELARPESWGGPKREDDEELPSDVD